MTADDLNRIIAEFPAHVRRAAESSKERIEAHIDLAIFAREAADVLERELPTNQEAVDFAATLRRIADAAEEHTKVERDRFLQLEDLIENLKRFES